MPDHHYMHPRLAAIYDVNNGWGIDRDFYLALASDTPERVLEIGCGTGILARAYARRGHDVVGFDPAQAMLDVGAREPGGDAIEWVRGEVEQMDLGQRFDLIIMTGHAFQVLLEVAHVDAAFSSIRDHLAEGGRLVFESRNPEVDWGARWADGFVTARSAHGEHHEARRVLWYTGERICFEVTYTFDDGEQLVSRSELRFFFSEEITDAIERAGLRLEHISGDWEGNAFDATHHEEMIFTVS